MSDSISRQAAIDVASRECHELRGLFSYIEQGLKELPSVQTEQSAQIQDILQFLDERLHPIVSPENWDVYSELHDMISGLSSAQTERWDTCFDCPLSHGCPVINGCTNEESMQYAGDIPDNCPLNKPERKGEWIYYDPNGFKCSRCGRYLEIECGDVKMNFCPNCGVRMVDKDG